MDALTQLTRPVSRWLGRGLHGPEETPADQDGTRLSVAGAQIRPRRDSDVASCARVLRGISSGGRYPLPRPASDRAWLYDDVLDAWVADRRGLVLGHIALAYVGTASPSALRWREVTGRPTSELAAVSRFFVRMPERGQGIGTALLATAARHAHASGLLPVVEIVGAGRDGVPIFEHNGWRRAGRSPYGRRGDDRTTYLYVKPPART